MQYKPLRANARIGRLQATILSYLGSRDLRAKTTEIAATLGGTLHRNTVPSAVRRLRERNLICACTGRLQGRYRITPAGAAALKEWQQATPAIGEPNPTNLRLQALAAKAATDPSIATPIKSALERAVDCMKQARAAAQEATVSPRRSS